jgi:lipopolysaccharide biosynthesis glycosyltransferase
MLVPALFVAWTAQCKLVGSSAKYDVIVFTGRGEATGEDKAWALRHGVTISDSLELSDVPAIRTPLKRLTSATLARLLLPEQLSERYDRILYLDADVTIEGDVGSIFSLDTGEHALGAVPAARFWTGSIASRKETVDHFRSLGLSEPFRYFNSGVLYIDVAKWNRDALGRQALDFIRRNPSVCIWPDEDALNAVLDGAVAELSPLWNMRARAWFHRRVRAAAEPVIVHYDGPSKPWQRFGNGRRLLHGRQAYRSYRRFLVQTPWPDWLEDQWTMTDLRAGLAHEVGLWTSWISGRETPLRRLRDERAYAEAFLTYIFAHRFADIDQGIVERTGKRLRLANASTVDSRDK